MPFFFRYRTAVGEVPEGHYTVPLGKAHIVRRGSDITLVGWGAQVLVLSKAAQEVYEKVDCAQTIWCWSDSYVSELLDSAMTCSCSPSQLDSTFGKCNTGIFERPPEKYGGVFWKKPF